MIEIDPDFGVVRRNTITGREETLDNLQKSYLGTRAVPGTDFVVTGVGGVHDPNSPEVTIFRDSSRSMTQSGMEGVLTGAQNIRHTILHEVGHDFYPDEAGADNYAAKHFK